VTDVLAPGFHDVNDLASCGFAYSNNNITSFNHV
jgi:hypothetical protein